MAPKLKGNGLDNCLVCGEDLNAYLNSEVFLPAAHKTIHEVCILHALGIRPKERQPYESPAVDHTEGLE